MRSWLLRLRSQDERNRLLLQAAGWGDADRVRLLIQAGADVHARDKDGRTALMWAARCGDADRVRLLIQAGADVNARDDFGHTALDTAVKQDVIDALQEARRLTSLD